MLKGIEQFLSSNPQVLFQRELRTTQGGSEISPYVKLNRESMCKSMLGRISLLPLPDWKLTKNLEQLWGTASIWIKGQPNVEQFIGTENGPSFKINCGEINICLHYNLQMLK